LLKASGSHAKVIAHSEVAVDRLSERELDERFWREISNSAEFRNWFLGKTKFAERQLELVTRDGEWQFRWYKDPTTGRESETDILLIFRDRENGDQYAIHIEDKPPHGAWQPEQAMHYPIRAKHLAEKFNYVDFQTVLVAPQAFIDRNRLDAAIFSFCIPYEEISEHIAEFVVVD
jgi:hypothetical protein